jgi:hypothetical protein
LIKENRPILSQIETPYFGGRGVILYDETFNEHIPIDRRTPEAVTFVSQTLQKPSFICQGTTNPGYLSFVNHEISSLGNGSPYVVFVDPEADQAPTVASFGFRRDFKSMENHTILWSR